MGCRRGVVSCSCQGKFLARKKWTSQPTACQLQKWFSGITRDGFARRVAKANQFVPIRGLTGSIVSRSRLRIDRRRNRNRYVRRARQICAIAQEPARACERDWHDGYTSIYRGAEGPQLERANSVFSGKGSFGEDENGFAFAQKFRELFGLLQARLRVAAVEGNMPHLQQKAADEGHLRNFALGDETIGDAEAEHKGKHVKIAGVIGGVDFRAGRIDKFFSVDPDPATHNGK